jgi:hypothetical protein
MLGLLNLAQTQLAVLVLQLLSDLLKLLIPHIGELLLKLVDRLIFEAQIFLH